MLVTCSIGEAHFRLFGANSFRVKVENRQFKKLRGLLQRKRHDEIERCIKLCDLRLFHVVQTRRSVLSLSWNGWVFV